MTEHHPKQCLELIDNRETYEKSNFSDVYCLNLLITLGARRGQPL